MNPKIKILVFTFFIPFFGFCQSFVFTGVNLSPRISKLKVLESFTNFEESGRLGFGYSLGIQFQYNPKKRLFIRSALSYLKIDHLHKEYQPGFAINGPDDPLPFIERKFEINSIEFTLDVGRLIKSKNEKYNFPVGIGGVMKYNLTTRTNSKLVSEFYGEQILSNLDDEITTAIYSIAFFGGVEVSLNKKIILGIEPTFILTPNKFIFGTTNSIAKTEFESGLMIRIRFK